jgi:hypothetical protein
VPDIGAGYISGELRILSKTTSGTGFLGQFSTYSNGSLFSTKIIDAGSGYTYADLNSTPISMVYNGTLFLQDGSITKFTIDDVGENYLAGDILIAPGIHGTNLIASFEVSLNGGFITR